MTRAAMIDEAVRRATTQGERREFAAHQAILVCPWSPDIVFRIRSEFRSLAALDSLARVLKRREDAEILEMIG